MKAMKFKTVCLASCVLLQLVDVSWASKDMCVDLSNIAKTVMIARQTGMPASQLRSNFLRVLSEDGAPKATSYDMDFIDYLIDQSYRAVQGRTLQERQAFIDAAQQGIYTWCVNQ